MAHVVSGEWMLDNGTVISGEFTTPQGLAHALGIGTHGVYWHLRQGHVRHYRAGRRVLIPMGEAKRIVRDYARNKAWRNVT